MRPRSDHLFQKPISTFAELYLILSPLDTSKILQTRFWYYLKTIAEALGVSKVKYRRKPVESDEMKITALKRSI